MITGEVFLKYKLVQILGRGGFSEVWRAVDTQTNKNVAIKFLFIPTADADAQKRIRRFKREAKNLSKLSHRNIAKFYEYGEHDGQHYIVMEFVEGTSLSQMKTPLDPDEAIEYALQICDALSAIHALGLVHRDIKPGNVIITEEQEAVLVDFGLTRGFGKESSITTEDEIVGTPAYMSPEQVAGGEIGPASDIYSLGATLFYTLTSRHPVSGSKEEVYERVYHGEIEPFLYPCPEIPRNIFEVIKKAMQKKPRKRYRSAEEFAKALFSCLGKTTRISWFEEKRRKRLLLRLIASGLFVILLLGVLVLFRIVDFTGEQEKIATKQPLPEKEQPSPKQPALLSAPEKKPPKSGEIKPKPSSPPVAKTIHKEPQPKPPEKLKPTTFETKKPKINVNEILKQAADNYASAIKQEDFDAKINYLELAEDNYSTALKHVKKKEKIFLKRGKVYWEMAEAYRRTGKEAKEFYQKARNDFLKFLKYKQDADVYWLCGWCSFYIGQSPAKYWQKAIELNPEKYKNKIRPFISDEK